VSTSPTVPNAPGPLLDGVGPQTIKSVALQSRPLSQAEASIVRQNLGDAIDPEDVRIAYDRSISGTDVKGYVMNRGLPTIIFTSPSASGEIPSSLMHEITHVWQNLHGDRYSNNIPIADTYSPQSGKAFEEYGPEAQATLVAAGDKSAQSFISAHKVRAANPADLAFLDSVRSVYGENSGLGADTDARLGTMRNEAFRGVRNGQLMADTSPDKAPNVKGMVNDPEFLGMSPQDQRTALFRLTNDQEFNQINDGEIIHFVNKLRTPQSPAQYAASQGAPPLQSQFPTPEKNATGRVVGAVTGAAKALTNYNPITMSKAMLGAGEVPVSGTPQPMSLSQYAGQASPANLISNTKNELEQTFAPGDTTEEKSGAAIANFLAFRGMGKAAKNAGAFEGAPLSDSAAAEKFTNAVNPPAKQMPAFQKNVEAQIQNIREAGQDVPIDQLPKALRAKADAMRNDYYDNILKPHADIPRGTDAIPNYGGGSVAPGQATLAQLDSRLSQINAELFPQYEKGGLAGRAALSTQERGMLQAEAAGIRNTLNGELAARNGTTPEAIAKARSDFGQMSNIADKLELAFNKARNAQNREANTPTSFDTTLTGVAARLAERARDKTFGTPASRAIKSALRGGG
jgi:hypothetical protein